MEFKRICPNCGKELMYKSETSYKNAIKSIIIVNVKIARDSCLLFGIAVE